MHQHPLGCFSTHAAAGRLPLRLQVLMIVYLVAVRPYPDWTLHYMEISVHGLQLGIFVFAAAILTSRDAVR